MDHLKDLVQKEVALEASEAMVVDIQNIPVATQVDLDFQDAHHVQLDNTYQQELQLVLVLPVLLHQLLV